MPFVPKENRICPKFIFHLVSKIYLQSQSQVGNTVITQHLFRVLKKKVPKNLKKWDAVFSFFFFIILKQNEKTFTSRRRRPS
jgi:hypothetical protein